MTSQFFIKSLNISKFKGTKKDPVDDVTVKEAVGIISDAHKGMKNREISLMSVEDIMAFKPDLAYGAFGENITTEGLDFSKINVLDRIKIGPVELEVSKIGKECHTKCSIYYAMGDCIFPRKGVFVRVLKGGKILSQTTATYHPKVYKIAVITLSDRASKGTYRDLSGEIIVDELTRHFTQSNKVLQLDKILIPDSKLKLFMKLLKYTRSRYDLIITTGGTGISPRDITIDIAKYFVQKELPGIMTYIREKYASQNINALLSRSLAGIHHKTILFCLPGSAKGVTEYMQEIMPMIDHIFAMVHDLDHTTIPNSYESGTKENIDKIDQVTSISKI